jgi:hypothetical protein
MTFRSAQNAKASGLKRSLGTISSSRCQTTRATRLHPWRVQAALRDFMFHGRALPVVSIDRITAGGARRDRTDDLLLAKQALSQLSYGPKSVTPAFAKASAGNLRGAKVGGPGKI